MDGTATVERPAISKVNDEGHDDLRLSPEELATEAAEAAATRERELGAAGEEVDAAYKRAYEATLEQVALDAETAAGDDDDDDDDAGEQEAPVMVPPDRLVVSGPSKASPGKWSGKAPGTMVLSVKGVKVEVSDGEFRKGDRLQFSGEAVVVSEGVKDKLDKDTKQPVEAVQEIGAVVLDWEIRAE
ncbi:MAG TPA: hypothetical protein VGN13_05535 [Solirubrobacteraceae bacterium]|jgi:hypothetical protein